jgi:hypothetical protein
MAVSVLLSCDSVVIAAARSLRIDPTERRAENSLLHTMLRKVQRLKTYRQKAYKSRINGLDTMSGMSSNYMYLVTKSEQAFATTESTHGRGPYA